MEAETDAPSAGSDRSYGSDDDGDGAVNEDSEAHESHGINQGTLNNFVLWKTNVTSLDENVGTVSVSGLPSGVYTLVLTIRPTSSGYSPGEDTSRDNYYRWTTYLVVK